MNQFNFGKKAFLNYAKTFCRVLTQQKLISRHYTNRRSLLYVPGSDVRKLTKAFQMKVDCIVMDCEDGVAFNQKEKARKNIKELLDQGPVTEKDPEWSVRVNSVQTPTFEEDINALLTAKNLPISICLPKVNTVDDLQLFAEKVWNLLIQRPENDRGPIKLLMLIESATAVMTLPELCKKAQDLSTMAPIIPVGLIFGCDDFIANIGATKTPSGLEMLHARQKIVLVAKAFGLQAIDMVFVDYKNQNGFKGSCKDGFILGYNGKQLIHPDQVVLIQDEFVPSRSQIQWAKKIMRTYKENQEKGKGAFSFEHMMVDMPTVKQAENILNMAMAVGKLDPEDLNI